MEAIRKFATVSDNKVVINLPPGFDGTEIELIILRPDSIRHQVNEGQTDYFAKHYGSMKSQLSDEEIDAKLKALREEWNRNI